MRKTSVFVIWLFQVSGFGGVLTMGDRINAMLGQKIVKVFLKSPEKVGLEMKDCIERVLQGLGGEKAGLKKNCVELVRESLLKKYKSWDLGSDVGNVKDGEDSEARLLELIQEA
jgi:hypothetical protein